MAYAAWSVTFGEQPSASKWNILGTNDASFNDGTGIGSGAYFTPWASWTPTITNLTLGSGSVTATYIQIGKTVHCKFRFIYGAGSAVGTGPYFTLPVTASSSGYSAVAGAAPFQGTGWILDSSSSTPLLAIPLSRSTTTCIIRLIGVAGTYANANEITSTVPITWATGDEIGVHFSYEAA